MVDAECAGMAHVCPHEREKGLIAAGLERQRIECGYAPILTGGSEGIGLATVRELARFYLRSPR